MVQSKYRIEETDINSDWDNFVQSSLNGTAFIESTYLNSIEVKKKGFYCYKANEKIAALLIIISNDGLNIVEHDYIIYSGLIYRDFSYLNRSQRYSEQFRIQEFVAEYLMNSYESIIINLHPSIVDVRPFLWVNYGTESPKYQIDLRYTSTLVIKDSSKANKLEEIKYFKDASGSRRQEIRYAINKKVSTKESLDVDVFIENYIKTMRSQNIFFESRRDSMKKLISSLLMNDKALLVHSRNREGNVGSSAVFLLDDKRAYYLFGANDPDMRSQHTGTAVLWDAFQLLDQKGYKEVDLEGINSPNRGWFKLSFGGDIRPYYRIIKNI